MSESEIGWANELIAAVREVVEELRGIRAEMAKKRAREEEKDTKWSNALGRRPEEKRSDERGRADGGSREDGARRGDQQERCGEEEKWGERKRMRREQRNEAGGGKEKDEQRTGKTDDEEEEDRGEKNKEERDGEKSGKIDEEARAKSRRRENRMAVGDGNCNEQRGSSAAGRKRRMKEDEEKAKVKPEVKKTGNDGFASRSMAINDDRPRNLTKADIYSSSLEANISGTGSGLSTPRTNSRKTSPVAIREAKIMSNPSPKSSPANKTFVPPRTPIVPSNPFDYDEKMNPFAEEAEEAGKILLGDENKNDYNDELNPFAS